MIEEINIEINKDLKQRGKFDFVPFESTITTDLFERNLKVEKKIYHCSWIYYFFIELHKN